MKKQMFKNPAVTLCLLVSSLIVGIFPASVPNTTSAQSEIPVEAIAWSEDGAKIAIGYTSGVVKILDGTSGSVEYTLQAHSSETDVVSVAWSPNGGQLASGNSVGNVTVWNTSDWHKVADRTDTNGGVIRLTWNTDSSRLVAFSVGYTPFLTWDATTFEMISSDINGGSYHSIAWSPDRSKVIVGIPTGGFVQVNSVSFEEQTVVYEDWLNALAWSPNGNFIATGNLQGTVKLWNAATLQPIATLNVGVPDYTDIDFPTTSTQAVGFSADSSTVYAVQGDGTVTGWNTTTFQQTQTGQLIDTPVYLAEFSPDGAKLAYAGNSGTLSITPVSNGVVCNATQTVASGDVAGFISAITAANANPDASVISVEGTYTFTAVNNGLNALPKITTDIKICAQNGATLTRQAGSPAFRFFEVASNGILTLENLTLTGADSGSEPGGAILNTGNLTVNNVTFTGNHAGMWR